MDVATAWIGNNILSVDFDHPFEYSLDKKRHAVYILALGTCTQTLFSKSFQHCAVYVHIFGLYT